MEDRGLGLLSFEPTWGASISKDQPELRTCIIVVAARFAIRSTTLAGLPTGDSFTYFSNFTCSMDSRRYYLTSGEMSLFSRWNISFWDSGLVEREVCTRFGLSMGSLSLGTSCFHASASFLNAKVVSVFFISSSNLLVSFWACSILFLRISF